MQLIRGASKISPVLATEHPPKRPEGVGATALLMSAFLLNDYVQSLMRLSGGNLAALFDGTHIAKTMGTLFVVGVVYFVIWNYWQGENWSRHLVLIWSALLVIEGISNVWEYGGSLTSAMAHPVLFLKCALAIFLLYWLNTAPLRAFFRGVPTVTDQLCQRLAGKLCTAVVQEPDGYGDQQRWRVSFEHEAELALQCPWRVVVDGNLGFASNSGAEVTPEVHPSRLVQNVRVTSVKVAPRSCDLRVVFEMGIELQTWTEDPRTTQWRYCEPDFAVAADSGGVKPQVTS